MSDGIRYVDEEDDDDPVLMAMEDDDPNILYSTMSEDYADLVDGVLGGALRTTASSRSAVPRRGLHPDFDDYCDQTIEGDFRGNREGLEEMRRALWATWRTEAPRGRELPARSTGAEDDEEAQLARAIAESVRESAQSSRQDTPIIVPDDSDDEDRVLKRVLALSEEEHRQPKRQKRDETPEEERKALAEAMAASLAAEEQKPIPVEDSDDEDIAKANAAFQASRQAFREEELRRRNAEASTKASSSAIAAKPQAAQGPLSPAPRMNASGALGDRAQMEKERLARQAARLAQSAGTSASGSSSSTVPTAAAKVSTPTSSVTTFSQLQQSAAGPSRSAFPVEPRQHQSSSARSIASSYHPLQASGPSPSDAAGEYYLDGELRHTKLEIGNSTTERTFTPQQVIGQKDQISLIIMSTFVADEEWMEPLLPPAEVVPRIVIRPHPKDQHPAWNGKVQRQDSSEIRCYPQMVGDWGSAHMKFIWVFYKTGRLRVAIMTANMVHYDWEWIENTIFVQDFLPRSASTSASSALGDFPKRFVDLFLHLKVHKALRHLLDHHPANQGIPIRPADAFADLAKYDWSRVKVKLVMSIPGTYTGADKMDDFGLCRLGKVLSDNGWKAQSGEVVRVEYQGSSLGAYTIDWINDFYQYSSGKNTRSLIGRPKPIAFPPIKVLFPTVATVDKSLLGRDGGGTMFCGKAYNGTTKHLFHDANSKRGGVLMHAKVLVATFEPRPNTLGMQSSPAKNGNGKRKAEEEEDEAAGVGGWVYVGSHNFSSAAWGNAKLKQGTPSLTIRNYELGIVFPLPRKDTQKVVDTIVPYQRPPRSYAATDLPWDQNTHTFSS